jgi:NAD(P)-dependent dehydrogenase (short-subunit alcohol dehydrogenase family)
MKLAGTAALVTGSSRGIGRGIALALAEHGADVAINYRADRPAAEAAAAEVRARGRRAAVLQADVTRPAEAPALVERAEEELGPIDILVNNVGDFFWKPLMAMSADEWDTVLASNLTSVFHLCRAAVPRMRARRHGRIVNVALSPVHLVRGAANVAAYAIAKTGVVILTRSLAVEEAAHGITVNCVSPGLIDNGFLPPEQELWMRKRVPMGRLGTPQEIGGAVAFLASDLASYVSGANLAVGGAWDWEDRPLGHDHIVQELFTAQKGS